MASLLKGEKPGLDFFQPLDAVRDYFGVKIALYFAWLGFYTNLLIAPSLVGLLTFLYGVVSLRSDIPR